MRTFRQGKSQINGYLTDYASLVAALIDIYESSFDIDYLDKALKINELIIQKFWDDVQGGFFFTSSDQKLLLIRSRNPYDNAVPSGNSIVINNLLRLSGFTGDNHLKLKAEQAVALFLSQAKNSPLGFAVLLSALDYFWGKAKEIIISGNRNSNTVQEIVRTIYDYYLPNKVLAFAEKESFKNREELLKKLSVIDGKFSNNSYSKIFVCENFTCKKPFTNVEQYKDFYRGLIQY